MKTENKYQVGQQYAHRKQGTIVTIVTVNEKAKNLMFEDEDGKQKSILFSNFAKSYAIVEEAEAPKKSKKSDGKKAGKSKTEKAQKDEKPTKKSKAKKEEAEEETLEPDPKWDDIMKLMKAHNKKDPTTLLTVIIVLAKDNFTSKYTEVQRSYRIVNNQPGLLAKAKRGEPVWCDALDGSDQFDYMSTMDFIEDAFVEVGDESEELPNYSEE